MIQPPFFDNNDKYDDTNTPLGITLNTSTYTVLLPANKNRIGYKVSADDSHTIVIKENVAGVPDNLIRGFKLHKRGLYESRAGDKPIGEISAIALTGSPIILVTEE